MSYCRRCGSKLPQDASLCPSCGTPLIQPDTKPTDARRVLEASLKELEYGRVLPDAKRNRQSIKAREKTDPKFTWIKSARNDLERMELTEKRLPDLGEYSLLNIEATKFDPLVRRALMLMENEKIFLAFIGFAGFPDFVGAQAFIFTDEKLLALDKNGKLLLIYALELTNPELEESSRNEFRKKVDKIISDVSVSPWSLRFSTMTPAIYPLDYSVVCNLRIGRVRQLFGQEDYSVKFMRTDRSPTMEYEIVNFPSIGGPEVWLPRESAKVNKKIREKLLNEGYSCEDLEGNLYNHPVVNCKIFLDALTLIPKERKKILNILRAKADGIKQFDEIMVAEDAFSSLKCDRCGASEFHRSPTSYETPEGRYSLLKCEYCGTEGAIMKKAETFKIFMPKK